VTVPRSQFEKVMNVDGPAIKVAGESVVGAQRAGEVHGPVELHFVVAQDGLVAHGTMPIQGPGWAGPAQAPAAWDLAKPACATGLTVQVMESPVAAIETFTWSEIVTLQNGPVQ
jgi:hypothetical protein